MASHLGFRGLAKNWYLDLLRVIEALSHDPIVNTLNKLGDSNKMICSRSSHYLLQLLQVHPFIKPIVAREISALVLKPMVKNNNNNNEDPSLRHHDHARYYGSITLNQIPLVKGEHEVSNKLIHLYFELFNDILGKEAQTEEEVQAKENEGNLNEKNEEDLEAENIEEQELIKKQFKNKKAGLKKKGTGKKSSKLIAEEEALADKKSKLVAAILTGLNRAFPYGSIDKQILKGYMNTLFRICHTGAFSVSIQALILIQHLLESKPDLNDRFYRVLYGTLIDYRLLISPSKHGLYLNLLFKSILPYHQPPFICSTLVLLGHLFSSKSNSGQLFSRRPEGEQLTDKEQYDGRNEILVMQMRISTVIKSLSSSCQIECHSLLTGEPISSSVDLTHHTLSNFLDKFVYRQPKKISSQKGSSIMQPDLHYRLGDVVKRRSATSAKINENVLMNSNPF
ncbi:hypothetical protein KEM48_007306 [Puccinia striiformis f. sp. tritici PST-130]|nr:hypothetical protein KEM48_007306 [Puccinia striiformis f. sp. tritici PST-130]